MTLRE
jgi:hypothetical protein